MCCVLKKTVGMSHETTSNVLKRKKSHQDGVELLDVAAKNCAESEDQGSTALIDSSRWKVPLPKLLVPNVSRGGGCRVALCNHNFLF